MLHQPKRALLAQRVRARRAAVGAARLRLTAAGPDGERAGAFANGRHLAQRRTVAVAAVCSADADMRPAAEQPQRAAVVIGPVLASYGHSSTSRADVVSQPLTRVYVPTGLSPVAFVPYQMVKEIPPHSHSMLSSQ